MMHKGEKHMMAKKKMVEMMRKKKTTKDEKMEAVAKATSY